MRQVKEKKATFKVVRTAKAQASLADQWFALRTARLAQKKITDTLEVQERAAKKALLESMEKYEVHAIGGNAVTVTLKYNTKVTVTDWDAVWKWAKKNDAYDLYQRRVSETAVKARWDDNKEIPGMEGIEIPELSHSTIK